MADYGSSRGHREENVCWDANVIGLQGHESSSDRKRSSSFFCIPLWCTFLFFISMPPPSPLQTYFEYAWGTDAMAPGGLNHCKRWLLFGPGHVGWPWAKRFLVPICENRDPRQCAWARWVVNAAPSTSLKGSWTRHSIQTNPRVLQRIL